MSNLIFSGIMQDNFDEFEQDNFEEDGDPIVFHSEEIDFELAEKEKLAEWIESAASAEGKAISAVNFIFCSDEYLYQMNVDFLQHDTYTDVITFPYASAEDEFIEGDIFISVERTRDNAKKFGVSAEHELHRVMIHGVLHLIGYDDKTAAKKKIMTAKEDEYLAKLLLV
jgi:rRNA maturation RNase YbeY